MCTVLLPPGVNPIAVNKYIIMRAARWSSILSETNAVRIYLRSIATSGSIRSSRYLRRGYPGIAGSNTAEGIDVYLL